MNADQSRLDRRDSVQTKEPETITANIESLNLPGVLSALSQMELEYVGGKRAWVPRHEYMASDRSAANNAKKGARVTHPSIFIQIKRNVAYSVGT